METNTAIVGYQVSNNLTLAESLMGLEDAIETAARANLAHILEGDDYTMIEQRAMLTVEMLKQVNGLELVAILMRGKYIKLITEENMLADHPEQYTSLETMAKSQGISASELSNTRDLVTIIFPYIEGTLGIKADMELVAQSQELTGRQLTGGPNDLDFRPVVRYMPLCLVVFQPLPRNVFDVFPRAGQVHYSSVSSWIFSATSLTCSDFTICTILSTITSADP